MLAAGALLALVLQSRHDIDREARNRSVSVAQTFAKSLGLREALDAPDPSSILQPLAEETRKAAGVDFIVVMDTHGIRYSHPQPDRIGKRFVGTIEPSLAGRVHTESVEGPLGKEIQAIVPVTSPQGDVVALVSAGLTVKSVTGVANRQLPVILLSIAGGLALATVGTALISRRLRRQTHGLGTQEMTRMYEHHDAVLHSVREGVLITDGEGRLLLANDEAGRLLGLPDDAEGRPVDEVGMDRRMADLLLSGRVATDEVLEAGGRLLVVNQRPTHPQGRPQGRPQGSAVTIRDSTEMRLLSSRAETARRRLRLLYDAGGDIGTTLDVVRTAQELADVAVPQFADFVTVDLADPVLEGDEPGPDSDMRRTAVSGIRADHPLYPLGTLIDFLPSTPQARGYGTGAAELVPDLRDAPGWHAQDPARTAAIVDYGIHSLIAAPLKARGVVLGVVNFWRSQKPEPFDEDDLFLAEELVGRAAVTMDNARRYTREHNLAVTLQRSLLPQDLPEQSAVDVAHFYQPAQSGVGGDWFDVIPLPGSRVALVVGDVVGHGLHAAATMGRLRTAVHNFSSLDLPPDELLARLDNLVQRMDQEGDGSAPMGGVMGATCLYAVYDPVSRLCSMARAGHMPPLVVAPDGTTTISELPAGPPLGLGGMPFETMELHLAEGSQLVLYTDGLVEERSRDIAEGVEMLRTALSHPDRDPQASRRAVLDALLPSQPSDDIALLIARTRTLGPGRVARWEVPFDPSEVGAVRSRAAGQLEEWGLEELVFSTELILSELVTNAIRYGAAPVHVRLLRDRTLTCEVWDSSSTAPHLRYAAGMDEGGRGLFLVAQISEHWGTRYTPEGKVIWAEQPLPTADR
ncbi:SpoIIE family protein phosphatase [Streptomyces sp. NPDC127092]|uniref:SpoIIE family protein phosphatase n=1 Tax=Streptomyces sp. NPDC127092 TaxID=3347135 RepID=UPI00366349FB